MNAPPPSSAITRWAWVPIPVLLVSFIALWAAHAHTPYESSILLVVLNFIFSTLASLAVAFLMARGFLAQRLPGMPLLGCGVLIWGVGSLVATLVGHGNANLSVTIHNLCVWLGACGHLAGIILSRKPARTASAAGWRLGASYGISLGMVWLVAMAALQGWTPVFFMQGQGGTMVRQFVLASAISMLVLSATLLRRDNGEVWPPFAYWYALALLLLAAGLLGVMIQTTAGSLLGWTARSAQYLGGAYMLVAARIASRERAPVILNLVNHPAKAPQLYLVALAIVIGAATLRLVFLSSLELRVPYLTFYPAVMLAALYGGLGPGFVATGFSALLADYYWIEPVESLVVAHPSDWLAFAIFLLNGAVISWITDAMRRWEVRATEAGVQARWAAELAQANAALRESEARSRRQTEWLQTLLDTAPTIICIAHDRECRSITGNRAAYEFSRVTTGEDLSKTGPAPERLAHYRIFHDGVELAPQEMPLQRVAATGQELSDYEVEFRFADGVVRSIVGNVRPLRDAEGRPAGAIAAFTDITDRKRAELERAIAVRFLGLINTSSGLRSLIAAAIDFFREQSGCEAVGVRLKEGDDYPYYETRGFSQAFVLVETSLCARDSAGKIERDTVGNPVIACMCGNVICGRFDPAQPFFTTAGSFWTNSTTQLLASTTEADRQARTRNRCHGEGYESVALIPLRSGGERLGLLQLNDRRSGQFTPGVIALWERLGGYLAVAIAKMQSDERLRQSTEELRAANASLRDSRLASLNLMADALAAREQTENLNQELHQQREWLRVTLNSIGDAVIATDTSGRITFLNPVAATLTGWAAEAALGQPIQNVFRLVNDQTHQPAEDIIGRVLREGCAINLANHLTMLNRDGREIPVEDSAAPIKDSEGALTGVVLVFHDVTAKRRAQMELHASHEDLLRLNRAMVGRELRMIELKQEVNELCAVASQTPRYPQDLGKPPLPVAADVRRLT